MDRSAASQVLAAWRPKSLIMKNPVKMGRHAEIVPVDGSHYVLVDGQQWSRHDDLAVAEAVRNTIVEGGLRNMSGEWTNGCQARIQAAEG